MARYKITIEYDGTEFYGWQNQKNKETVQGAIENAIFQFSSIKANVVGAGRTDRGVHALRQVAHFDFEKNMPIRNIKEAMNHFLKEKRVVIRDIENVSNDFHARFSAKSRTYIYIIINRAFPLALDYKRAWYRYCDLDVAKMHKCAQVLLGIHDFSGFRSTSCQSKSAVRSINSISIKRVSAENIEITIAAPSFLHNQVRIIVGTLYNIGSGLWPMDRILTILKTGDRKLAGPTAPPHGLYLAEIGY